MPNITKLTTLPGGLRVATCEMPHAQTAAMGIWASVGGQHEPAAQGHYFSPSIPAAACIAYQNGRQ